MTFYKKTIVKVFVNLIGPHMCVILKYACMHKLKQFVNYFY